MNPRAEIRKSLVLTPQEWEHLEQLAADFETTPPSGVTAGQPSWRSLIKEIARGELQITRKEINDDRIRHETMP